VCIVIVDAFAASRHALRCELAAEGGFTVVGAAGDGAGALDVIRTHRAHVLLLDAAPPRTGGLETLRHLRDSGTGVPAVILTDSMENPEVVPALMLGAHGILPKGALPSARGECMKVVARGEYWIGTDPARDVVEAWQRICEVSSLATPAVV
jgi:DNA-binding NarL/FixJ family response regulator